MGKVCSCFSHFSLSPISQVFWAILRMMLMPVSSDYLTSFNCHGKLAKNADLTCQCHFINLTPEIIIHKITEQGKNINECEKILKLNWTTTDEIWSLNHIWKFHSDNFIFKQKCCNSLQYNLLKDCCKRILVKPCTEVMD